MDGLNGKEISHHLFRTNYDVFLPRGLKRKAGRDIDIRIGRPFTLYNVPVCANVYPFHDFHLGNITEPIGLVYQTGFCLMTLLWDRVRCDDVP